MAVKLETVAWLRPVAKLAEAQALGAKLGIQCGMRPHRNSGPRLARKTIRIVDRGAASP